MIGEREAGVFGFHGPEGKGFGADEKWILLKKRVLIGPARDDSVYE
jgi:hypothetical protein